MILQGKQCGNEGPLHQIRKNTEKKTNKKVQHTIRLKNFKPIVHTIFPFLINKLHIYRVAN